MSDPTRISAQDRDRPAPTSAIRRTQERPLAEGQIGHFSYIGEPRSARNKHRSRHGHRQFRRRGKHRTEIGARAFIGSDTILRAPVRIGDDARTGAGSVVTRDVPTGATVVGMPGAADTAKAGRSGRRKGGVGGRADAGIRGTSHPQLAEEIMRELEAPLGRAVVGTWKNGETRVKLEENVRGSDIFVIQSMCAPVNHHLMELLLIIDALRRASAGRITAVIPYIATPSRRRRRPAASRSRPSSSPTCSSPPARIASCHRSALRRPSRASSISRSIICAPRRSWRVISSRARCHDLVVVSPDAGGVRARGRLRGRIGGGLAIISKQPRGRRRRGTRDGRRCRRQACGHRRRHDLDRRHAGRSGRAPFQERGASPVFAAATHGVFAGRACTWRSRRLDKVLVTDTLPLAGQWTRGKHASRLRSRRSSRRRSSPHPQGPQT